MDTNTEVNTILILSFVENHAAHTELGLWVLTGLLSFLVVEKIFPDGADDDEEDEEEEKEEQVQVHMIKFRIQLWNVGRPIDGIVLCNVCVLKSPGCRDFFYKTWKTVELADLFY